MAFRLAKNEFPLNNVEYNSLEAKQFLNMYKEGVNDKLLSELHVPSKSFAPSSLRCKRQQWFRLRGTKPDAVDKADCTLKFIASIGTYCHEEMQRNLKKFLKEDWLDVEEYLKQNKPSFEYTCTKNGMETQVKIKDPVVKFACDGIVMFNGKAHLLEIKTSESRSMKALVAPKSEHLNQIMCYCTLLNIDNAIVMYQDRQYGFLKCFTYELSDKDRSSVLNTFKEVQSCLDRNMIPEALPVGDKWCNSSYCRYFKTCRKWGV